MKKIGILDLPELPSSHRGRANRSLDMGKALDDFDGSEPTTIDDVLRLVVAIIEQKNFVANDRARCRRISVRQLPRNSRFQKHAISGPYVQAPQIRDNRGDGAPELPIAPAATRAG